MVGLFWLRYKGSKLSSTPFYSNIAHTIKCIDMLELGAGIMLELAHGFLS